MKRRLGLKLWSHNVDWLTYAEKLFDEGIYQFIELYILPDTTEFVEQWARQRIPVQIHATHNLHGFNLAEPSKKEFNLKVYKQIREFADRCNAPSIVFHGGTDGNLQETIQQLQSFHEPRALIENKPYYPIRAIPDAKCCRGASIEEVQAIIQAVHCGFCLDICHAVCAANAFHKEPYAYIDKLLALKPKQLHLSDIPIDSTIDQHLHYGDGSVNIPDVLKKVAKDLPIVIETKKDPNKHLEDFRADAEYLRRLE